LEMGEEGLYARKAARQGPRPGLLPAPVGEEGAQVDRAQAPEIVEGHRAAHMAGEEGHELVEIASIGLEGSGRQPAGGFELAAPIGDMGAQGGGNGKSGIGHEGETNAGRLASRQEETGRIEELAYGALV